MGLYDVVDDVDVDSVLVAEDVAGAPDLQPGDLRVRTGDLRRKTVHGFTDDALRRVAAHSATAFP